MRPIPWFLIGWLALTVIFVAEIVTGEIYALCKPIQLDGVYNAFFLLAFVSLSMIPMIAIAFHMLRQLKADNHYYWIKLRECRMELGEDIDATHYQMVEQYE